MNVSDTIEKLNEKNFFIVYDVGYYYHKIKGIFFCEEDAIKCWEEFSRLKYTKESYEKYISSAMIIEGHWFYKIETISFKILFDEYKKMIERITVENEANKIIEKGNKQIVRIAQNEMEEKIKERMTGLLYYLEINDLIPCFLDYKKKKENFFKYYKKE